jgi:hypothetical protein
LYNQDKTAPLLSLIKEAPKLGVVGQTLNIVDSLKDLKSLERIGDRLKSILELVHAVRSEVMLKSTFFAMIKLKIKV